MADQKCTDAVDWEDLRHFLALARHGSLSATARALKVNHATVSRRVAALEAALGKVLFDRRADGYGLTAEGRAILDEAQPMEDAALAVLRRLDRGAELNGVVRLTTTRALADGFLVERLAAFHARHPQVAVEVLTGSRAFSLARREADLALRFGPPGDSELKARLLTRVAHRFYGTERWLAEVEAGGVPPLVGFDDGSRAVPEAAWLARALPGARFSFRSDSWQAQALAAAGGMGVALLPAYLAERHPTLVPVPLSVPEPPPERELWMLLRPDLARVPRVRAVADYLAGLFRPSVGTAVALL
jgi:DNA-binding transcriptional LysR family regulator